MSIAQHKIEFEQAIREIDADIIDLTWAGEVMKYEAFRLIHDHPSEYLWEALELFRNAQGQTQLRRIIALSMQKLDLEQYLTFLNEALQMLEEGTINMGEFKGCCFPSYDWNTLLAEHYANTQVMAFLHRLLQSTKLPIELKTYVEDHIMSGKALQQIQYLRRVGEIK